MMYFELVPTYLCRSPGSDWSSCTKEKFCGHPDVEFKVDYSNTLSLHNWISDYDMHCSDKVAFGLFGSLFFIAVVVGCLVLTPLSDKPNIGRKKIMMACCVLHILCLLVLIFTSNLKIAYIVIFIMGIAFPGRCVVGFIWASECMEAKYVKFYTSVLFALDGLCLCSASIFFRYISVNWKAYTASYLVMISLGTILLIFQTESPKFTHNQGQFKKARQIIAKISDRNSKQNDGQAFVRELEEESV
jgi:MFS family permease